ncbi:MAG: redoxin domain-containing protein [Ferruginibacter sp.]
MNRQITLILFAFTLLNHTYGQRTLISGDIQNLTANSIKCNFIPDNVFEKVKSITIPLSKGKFSQVLNIKKTTFIGFEEGTNYYGGFIEPGDSIVITYDAAKFKNTISYSGIGKEKFLLSDSINQIRSAFNDEKEKIKNQPYPVDYLFSKIDSYKNKLVQRLISSKGLMSGESFRLLNAYIAANVLRTKYNGAVSIFGDSYDNIQRTQQSRLSAASQIALKNLLKFDNNLSYSYFYTSNVASIFSAYYDDNLKPGLGDKLHSKYSYLSNHLPLKLKSSVLLLFLEREIGQNKDAAIESIITESFPFEKDSIYKKHLTETLTAARALKNGIPAPNFSLENVDGEKIQLSSFRGKVIYMDFWFAACTPCHKLFNDIKSVKEYFKSDSNVVFLSVSIDNNEVWKKAMKKFKIDGYHAFTENKFRDHPIIRTYNVTEYPTTFLINKNGKLININPSHDPGELKKEIEVALTAEGN